MDKQQQHSEEQREVYPDLTVADKVANLPKSSGVYQFKNERGDIIYVGKAKNLRNRVRSYFQQGRPVDAKTKALVRHIADVEIIVVDSEVEALILENTLIKKLKPKYNIMLRDDKTYPYIRVTSEPFPRIFLTRKVIRDGSKYFGPYTDAGYARTLLKTLRTLFPIRSCDLVINSESIARGKMKVCLDFHIKKCEGPCEGLMSAERYSDMIKQAMQVLAGKTRAVEREMEAEMGRLAEDFRFEEAALVRNRYLALKEYEAKQKVLTTDPVDRDIMAIAQQDEDACTVIFKVRDGKLTGKQHFYLANAGGKAAEELLQSTFERFYLDSDDVPGEIVLPVELEEASILEQWLSSKRGSKVEITVPKIGEKLKLVNMTAANARFLLKELEIQRLKRDDAVPRTVLALERDLRLSKPPRRIECFDNSHFQGSETVSSMVVFVDGRPKKSEYRKYKIRTVEGIDDFKSMQEVVRRRYTRMLEEKTEQPDLIIVDGGKGQLSSAVAIMQELGLHGKIPIVGLAKRLEEVFFPGQSDALLLPRSSSSLRLLQQVRDEAHRFAITFHRSLRDKRTLQTELTAIDGIGEKTAQKLLTHFGSVEGVRCAERTELERIVGKQTTQKVLQYFAVQGAQNSEDSAADSELVDEILPDEAFMSETFTDKEREPFTADEEE